MKINQIHLDDFQNYDDESVELPEGVTLIRGSNGSGKSTLLRALFAGLFASDAASQTINIESMDKLVREGQDSASINLDFSIGDTEYDIEWEINVTEDDEGERSASTRKFVLQSDSLDEPIEGVQDVTSYMQSLLGMDAEAFVNSVYVQQSDLKRLASEDAEKRAKTIDNLLGLSEIDDYIERMEEKGRRAANAIKEEAENRQQEVADELAQLPDLDELKRRKRELSKEISDIETEIEETEEKLEDYQPKLQKAKQNIKEYKELQQQKQELEEKLSNKKEKKQQIQEETEELVEEIQSKRQKASEIEQELRQNVDIPEEAEIETLHEDYKEEKEEARETANELSQQETELETKLSSKRETLDTFETEVGDLKDEKTEVEKKLEEARSELEEGQDRLAELEERLQQAKEEKEAALEEFSTNTEDKEEIRREIESIAVGKLEENADEIGEQFKRGLHEVLPAFDKVERLSFERDIAEMEASDMEKEIAQLEAEKSEREEEIKERKDQMDDLRETISELKERLQKVQNEMKTARTQVNKYDTLATKCETIASLQNEADNTQERIGAMNNRKNDIKERIEELQSELADMESELEGKDLKDHKKIKQNVEKAIQKLKKERQELNEELQDLRGERTRVEGQIETCEKRTERYEKLEERRQWADERYQECQQIIGAYKRAKQDLRRENVALLNKYVNELFNELYTERSYKGVHIGEDYDIKLVRSDDTMMEPALASGGEGTILNIALRAGIYRLITERSGHSQDTLPPFILDEPTESLDSEHVSELDALMRKMREWNVEQVVIVSHEESLIDSADNQIRAFKDDEDISHAIVENNE